LRNQIQECKGTCEYIRDDIDYIRSDESTITDLRVKKDKLKKQIQRLTHDNHAIPVLEKHVKDQTETIKKLRTRVAKLEDEKARLKRKKDLLKREMQTLKDQNLELSVLKIKYNLLVASRSEAVGEIKKSSTNHSEIKDEDY